MKRFLSFHYLLAILLCSISLPSLAATEYSVEQYIQACADGPLGEEVTVTGYIVGWVNGTSISNGATFTLPAEVVTNMLIADSTSETDPNHVVPVQLPSGSIRAALNLVDNPQNFHHQIAITGSSEKYFALNAGIKSVDSYVWIGDTPVADTSGFPTGSKDSPLTVDEFLAQGTPNVAVDNTYLKGYIVGYIDGMSVSGAVFNVNDVSSNTNILIAASADETDYTKCVPVQLPSGEIRLALNLQDNPYNLGCIVTLCGSHEKYYAVNGLKSVSWFSLYDTGGENDLVNVYYRIVNDHAVVMGANTLLSDIIIDNEIEYDGIIYRVTEIDNYAFFNRPNLQSITIPNSITSIGASAFSNCTALTSITIPESVTFIGNNAFSNCYSLSSISFNAIKCADFNSSENPAFPTTLSSITFGENVTTIPAYLLYNGSKIENLNVSNLVATIGESAFRNNSNLKSITLGSNLESIGSYAFYGCTGLSSVTIPETVNFIDEYAFRNCPSLTSLYFNAINCAISGSVNSPAFPSSISSLTFGNNVSTIPAYLLSFGSKIETLTIPESVTTIGVSAFENCSSIDSITIPSNIREIGNSAFAGCSSLTSITFNASNCNICGSYEKPAFPPSISNIEFGEDVSIIPDYFLSSGSSLTTLSLPTTLTSIGTEAFKNCNSLENIVIPPAVTSIGYNAFGGCDNLLKNAYPSNLQNPFNSGLSIAYDSDCIIDDDGNIYDKSQTKLYYVPTYCKGNFIVPNSVAEIKKSAFYGCSNIKSITFGTGLLNIDNSSFEDTDIIKSLWLGTQPPSGVEFVNASANFTTTENFSLPNTIIYPLLGSSFSVDGIVYVPINSSAQNCDIIDCIYSDEFKDPIISNKIKNRDAEMTVMDIAQYAFNDNDFIESIEIYNNGNIGMFAFDNCHNLKSVKISNSGEIGVCSFGNLKNLTYLSIGDNVTAIRQSAFSGCSMIREVNIPDSVTEIEMYAFNGCYSLSDFIIGRNLTTLKGNIFNDCYSLHSLSIPYNIKSIENNAFNGCSTLITVRFEAETEDDSPSEENVLTLGNNGFMPLFNDCQLTNVYIGRKLAYNTDSSYGYSPFCNNKYLRVVEISDAETTIYDNEFLGCSNLRTVNIGNGVTAIGNYAFAGCTTLNSFSAGYKLESIGTEAFSACSKIADFYSYSITPPICGNSALVDIVKWDCNLHVPAESSEAYKTADQWKDFFFISEMDAVSIEELCLNYSEVRMGINEQLQLIAELIPANATNYGINWSSSAPNIVEVSSDGLITAKAVGEATITAYSADGNVQTSCLILVDSTDVDPIGVDESDFSVEYFNLNGIQVDADYLAPGIYIKKQGKSIQKIIVK